MKKLIRNLIHYFKLQNVIFRICSRYGEKNIQEKNATDVLEYFSPRPSTGFYHHNQIVNDKYDLQIIIPVYNVEKYIKHCLDSVFNQVTNYSVLTIIINDGSTDSSLEIIKEYKQYPNVVLINQKNKGMAGARNAGLCNIYAKYLMFVDSDDFLPQGAIDSLLSKAFKEDLDIVQGSLVRVYQRGRTYKEVLNQNKNDNLTGFPAGKVYRSTIFENICFPEGYWFEDTINRAYIFNQNLKFSIIPKVVYYYNVGNPQSITKQYLNPKRIDTFWITLLFYNDILIEDGNRIFYCKQILNQIIINYKRTKYFTLKIKKAIFTATVDLFSKHFSINILEYLDNKNKFLVISLLEKNFLLYEAVCNLS